MNIKQFFKDQWRESLARSIWVDLTVFGRITIWIPMWLLCLCAMAVIVPVLLLAVGFEWIYDRTLGRLFGKIPGLPPIFFK